MNNFNTDLIYAIKEVNRIKEYGNFRTVKNKFGEKKLKVLLHRLYPKYTITELEEMTNIPDSTLSAWFRYFKIPSKRWHMKTFSKVGNGNRESIMEGGKIMKRVVTIKMDQDLAYLIGFSLGDGSIQKYTLEVFNKDMELYQHLYSILKKYGKVSEKKVRDNGLWTLRLNNVQLTGIVKREGEINKETINIFKRKKLARIFTAAFWDAEGRVSHQNNHFNIYLYNTNRYLLNKIGRFLKAQGIAYSVHSRINLKRKYILEGRLVRAKKILHRIAIPKKSYLTWAKEIGAHMHSKKGQIVGEITSSLNG